MREKRLLWNTITSIINQIATIVCAFILPRLILSTFGSDVNGLLSSIQQFLAVITFLDLGIGAVVQSSLYRPLSVQDISEISKIMVSANKYFKKIAVAIIVYIVGLLFAYPWISHSAFDSVYSGTLILSMSISYFAQYFFGLRNQLLLSADQRGYIHYRLSTLVLILNNILCVFLIKAGYNIQVVKFTTAVVLLIRPLIMQIYVKRHYAIDWKIQYTGEPIKQKWNGVAQHLATVVLNSTDTIVLTIFSTLKDVSIYNVYYLVLNGLKNLVLSFSNGYTSYFGSMLAQKEYALLKRRFNNYETVYHAIITYIYGCTTILIMPFVKVYTYGVTDVSYIVPAFAYLICFANMAYCFRSPYNSLVLAAGHYKQTEKSAWIEMALNIVISIVTVMRYGLVGVAIGTLAAMVYRTVYLAWYTGRNFLNRSMKTFVAHISVDIACVVALFSCTKYFIGNTVNNYWEWILLGIKVAAIYAVICMLLNGFLYVFFLKEKENER